MHLQDVDCGGPDCQECGSTSTPSGQVTKLPWPEPEVSDIGGSLTASAPTASRGTSVATLAYLDTDSQYYSDMGAVIYEGERAGSVRVGRLRDNGPGFVSMDASGNYLMVGNAYPADINHPTQTNHVAVFKRPDADLDTQTFWILASLIQIPGGWSNVEPYNFGGVLSADAKTAVLMHQDAIYITKSKDLTVRLPTWSVIATIPKPAGIESRFARPLAFARDSGNVLLACAITKEGQFE